MKKQRNLTEMYKSKFLIVFSIGLIILACFAHLYAETSADETLIANKEQTFTLKGKEEKTFYLNLKKGEFAEISWNDSLHRFPDFSLFSPSGKNIIEETYVTDSLPFVAVEDGRYRLNVKFDETENENAEAVISLGYTNLFKIPKSAKLRRQRKVNGYDIKVYNTSEDESSTYLLIEKNGKLQQLLKGGSLVAGGFNFADDAALFDFPEGKKSASLMRTTIDKTGEGTPDIAVQFYTGGAHCCTYLHFFELSKTEIRQTKVVEGADSDVLATGKKPGGSLILKTGDSNFAYWLTSFAGSPIPTVILTFKDSEFRPDSKLMKKSPPTMAVLKRKADKARKQMTLGSYRGEEQDGFLDAFWGEMLDLMYAGNETAAWQYFDMVWDKRKAGKELFKQDFLKHLNESKYWQMMQEDKR
jgi:hypothetical protein